MTRRTLFFLMWGLLYSFVAQGADIPKQCWQDAAKRYNVNAELLYVIAAQESAYQYDAINVNRNGTYDVGLMQINSIWFKELAQYGIQESDLFNPCVNIHIGAWVLAQAIEHYGNTWRAVGAYNAGTRETAKAEERRRSYALRVYRRWQRAADRMR